MKIKSILAACLAFAPLSMFAQSSLTIFSEDGYKFFLILNGQKQNNTPVTNIHIDGLSQPYYSTKIIFEDGTKKEITKNLGVVDPSTNAFADVTYKIKTQKDGDIKMRYFSATPVVPNYVAPPDMYVMHYGSPTPPPPPPPPAGGGMSGGTTVTQTTVTQTSGGPAMGGGGVSMGVGIGGVNMNVSISDPTMINSNTTVTQTTTTTTSSSGYSSTSYSDAPPPPPPPPARGGRRGGNDCSYAMGASDFSAAKKTIESASFDDTRLSTAKTIISSNCMSTDQIMQVCKMFSFEQSSLDFAKAAYGRCTDPGSYFKVGNVFSFDASRTELNNYISGN